MANTYSGTSCFGKMDVTLSLIRIAGKNEDAMIGGKFSLQHQLRASYC